MKLIHGTISEFADHDEIDFLEDKYLQPALFAMITNWRTLFWILTMRGNRRRSNSSYCIHLRELEEQVPIRRVIPCLPVIKFGFFVIHDENAGSDFLSSHDENAGNS
jgi:hypothetical protein